jgi:SAM-dependent methyltransferase
VNRSEGQETADVGRLMSDLQAAVAQRGEALERQFSELEAAIAVILHKEDFSRLGQSQGEANQLFHEVQAGLHAAPPGDSGISFGDLARVPGASRPWLSPKRWIAAAMRLLWRRQEAFNTEVARRLELAAPRALLELHIAMSARLLGTLNTLVRRTIETDRAMADWQADLLGRLTALFGETGIARPHPETGTDAPRAQTAALAAEAVNAAMQSHGTQLQAAAAAASEVAALRTRLANLATEIARHAEALSTRIATAEQRIEESTRSVAELDARISTAGVQMPAGLMPPDTTAAAPPPPRGDSPAQALQLRTPAGTFSFLDFEDQLRGSEERIAVEQKKYVEWFAGAENVLDAGCGRGEFLELLRAAGVDARGIDTDPDMVAHCVSKGLRAQEGDLIAHLEGIDDTSLGGVFLGQVAEHLESATLMALPGLLFQKLKPGAAVVLETINPTCLTTFSGALYADPTHIRPIHPRALEYLLRAAGFEGATIMFSAPVAVSDRLAPLRESAPVDPAVKDVLLQMNANIAKLNSVLYSYGNYAMAARKPAA